MSLDITLYADITADNLKKILQGKISSSQFSSYDDWYSTYPAGRFDSEILQDKGIDIKVMSTAGFRVRKESRVEEMNFLKNLLKDISECHKATMLLNGELF